MKTKILTLALLAALPACNQAPANNVAAGNNSAAAAPANTSAAAPTAGVGQAALPAGLDCVRNRLTPDQRRDAAAVAMEQGSRDDPRMQPLVDATDSCAGELSWSPEKKRLAGMFSISAAGAAGLREFLRGRGVNIDELDQAIVADQELMAAAGDPQQLTPAAQQFVVRHAELLTRIAGPQGLDQELGTRIGNYIAFRALAEGLARSFGQTG